MSTPHRSVQDIMQCMCDLLGHPEATIWDRYGPQNRKELLRKLQIIFDPDVSDRNVVASDLELETAHEADHGYCLQDLKPLTPVVEALATAIWAQRKYCEGTLLMSPIFMATVPVDEYNKHGLTSNVYSIHPLFRVAKCFDSSGQTVNCCTVFVDESGRVYCNWLDYVANNQLGSSVILVAPTNGVFHQDQAGRVRLSSTKEHHRFSINKPASVVGFVASGIGAAALFTPLLPVALVTGALMAGVACTSVAIGGGIGRLADRSRHEQSIGLQDKESRGVWLGIGGSVVAVSAGAAMQGVKIAAENGQILSKAATAAVTGLGAAAIATNGVVLANGFYGFFTDDKPSLMEVLQLSSSLFLLTHSIANFQTARSLYAASQKSTLQSFVKVLSENQQRVFGKMLRQTVRPSVTQSGYADVFRSFRSIDQSSGSFQNISNRPKVTCNSTAVFNEALSPGGLQLLAIDMKNELMAIIGNMSPLSAIQFVWRFYQQNQQLIGEQLHIHFDDRFIADVCRIVRFLAEQTGKIMIEFVRFTSEKVIYGKLTMLYENRLMQMVARFAIGSMEEAYAGCVEMLNSFVRYIQDMAGFRETILGLLEELSHRVINRLIILSKCSFGAMLEMGFTSFVSFDGFFNEVLEVVLQMARENGFQDLSMYVLCMENVDMDQVHDRIKRQFEWLKKSSSGAIKCKTCNGHYKIGPVS